MKITLAEFERVGKAPPLEMFSQGIKAEETREKYTRTLRRVLCCVFEEILEGTFEERAEQLVRLSDPAVLPHIVCDQLPARRLSF